MGAWGNKAFENDIAADMISELEEMVKNDENVYNWISSQILNTLNKGSDSWITFDEEEILKHDSYYYLAMAITYLDTIINETPNGSLDVISKIMTGENDYSDETLNELNNLINTQYMEFVKSFNITRDEALTLKNEIIEAIEILISDKRTKCWVNPEEFKKQYRDISKKIKNIQ